MADHLAHIAKQEKITADYQALEVIAQKADGGLRDALSMFDLNVTFSSGDTLTYESVLENLHILDYDYYFRMSDALASGNLSEALLIYNNILQKGFDGHQFVVGLNEHFRNLLVSKDPQTVKLMEVSEVVQKRFIDQSKSMDIGLLMSALSVGSQIDLNYKTSKNQRLHVEIGLMKLSQISQILRLSELPSAPEPETTEKKKLTPKSETPEVAKVEAPIVQQKTVQPEAVAQTPPISEKQETETANITQEPPKEVYKTTVKSAAAMRKSSLRSTTDLTPEAIVRSEVKTAENRPSVSAPRNSEFTPEALQKAVDDFRETISSDSIKIILKNGYKFKDNTLTFSLSNTFQETSFTEIKQELATFVRNEIKNNEVQFDAIIKKSDIKLRPYTAQEKYNAMKAKNPALEKLREVMNLDLIQ